MQNNRYVIVPLQDIHKNITIKRAERENYYSTLKQFLAMPSIIPAKKCIELADEFRTAVHENKCFDYILTNSEIMPTANVIRDGLSPCFSNIYRFCFDPVTGFSMLSPVRIEKKKPRIRHKLSYTDIPVKLDTTESNNSDTFLSKILNTAASMCPSYSIGIIPFIDEFRDAINGQTQYCCLIGMNEHGIMKWNIERSGVDAILSTVAKPEYDIRGENQVWLAEYSVKKDEALFVQVALSNPIMSVHGKKYVCYRSTRKYTQK